MDKYERYREMVARRKACRMCQELTNPSSYMDGVFDSDHIGPWSRWHGDLDAKLVVVGQDWGNEEYFKKHKGHDLDKTPSNANLRKFLTSIGFELNPTSGATQHHQGLFFTNAVLCLKKDKMSSPVNNTWVRNCGHFLKETIDIIRPKVVASLGRHACISMIELYGLKQGRLADLNLIDLIRETEGSQLLENTLYYPMYHPSPLAGLKDRNQSQQIEDWQRIKSILYSK
jgi:uracil-DNA glycosylase family 4